VEVQPLLVVWGIASFCRGVEDVHFARCESQDASFKLRTPTAARTVNDARWCYVADPTHPLNAKCRLVHPQDTTKLVHRETTCYPTAVCLPDACPLQSAIG